MNRMRNYFGGGQQNNGGPGLPGPFGNMMNVVGKFREFMQNPIGAMFGSGLNIPQNIQNNSTQPIDVKNLVIDFDRKDLNGAN